MLNAADDSVLVEESADEEGRLQRAAEEKDRRVSFLGLSNNILS